MKRTHSGFTLVELMIVVSIIGVLAAMAVPAYEYALAKSHQAEAKVNLAGIYDLETGYFSENNTYGSFDDIGFSTEGGTHYSYCVAQDSCIAAVVPFDYGASGSEGGSRTVKGIERKIARLTPLLVCRRNAHYSTTSFEADACGVISAAPAPNDIDQWMTDEERDLMNLVVGY